MANPKKRMTSTRSGNRRSHHALKAKNLVTCPKCKASIMSHQVCKNCGMYNGVQVIKIASTNKK